MTYTLENHAPNIPKVKLENVADTTLTTEDTNLTRNHVPQESLLSPTIFLLHINDMLSHKTQFINKSWNNEYVASKVKNYIPIHMFKRSSYIYIALIFFWQR